MIYIDEFGYLWCNGIRLPCRVKYDDEVVEFKDRNKWRSRERGTEFIRISISEFISLLSGNNHLQNK